MADYESRMQQMAPEDVDALIRQYESGLAPDTERPRSTEEVEQLFELMTAHSTQGDHARAGQLFALLRDVITDYRARNVDEEKGLEYLIDWSLLALRFTPESRDEFVCMPIYRELFAAIDAGPASLKYRKVQAQSQLHRHYLYWLNNGGDTEALAEDELAFLQAAEGEYAANLEATLEAYEEAGDNGIMIKLHRNAAQFALMQQQPNDAIRHLKATRDLLPEMEDYHPADLGDVNLEIGRIFMSYKKYEVSLRYFNEALDIYREGGEELEMFAYQAEGWIEEVRKMM